MVKDLNRDLFLLHKRNLTVIGIKFLVIKMMKTQTKPIKLINPVNQEIWMCKDYKLTQAVDGVDYIVVYKQENESRKVLMRKDALRKTGAV